jgi:hypothetical protein
MEIAVRDEKFDLVALNRRVPLPSRADADDDDRRLALEVRAKLWAEGPADEYAVLAACAIRSMAEHGGDLEADETAEMGNRLNQILRGDHTLSAPPSPRAAAWAGRVFEDEQRQDLLVVAAGQYLAGRLTKSGGELFQTKSGGELFQWLRGLDWMGLPDADVAMVAQAIARRISAAEAENRVGVIDPIVGYGFEQESVVQSDMSTKEIIAVNSGLMRLRIIGDSYELECELWPCPVTMKAADFLRARSSAREIFKQTGIQADNPAGRWRLVWETHGLRDRLIQAADRDDPGERATRIVTWLRTVESSALPADRAKPDGSAARLPDGAVVASMPWLVAKAIGDAIARESEREAVEAVIRANTGESTRRTDGGRSIRLRIVPTKTPLVIEALDCDIEKIA